MARKDNIEWEDGLVPRAIDALATLGVFFFILWIIFSLANEYNLGGGTIPLENIWVAILFLFLLGWGLYAHFSDEVKINSQFSFLSRYVSYGKDTKTLAIALLVGLIIGFLLQSSTFFNLAIPTLASATVLATMEMQLWRWIWTVLIAPFVEEKVFAGSLPVQLHAIFATKLGNAPAKYISWVLTSVLFASLHYVVYSYTAQYNPSLNATSLMIGAFIFRLFALQLNDMFKSTGASYGMHVMNNLLQVVKG